MNWYYVKQGQQTGPIGDDELRAQVAAGAIRPDTLVWHEGMSGWLPYGEAAGGAGGGVAPGGVAGGGVAAGAAGTCSQCGRAFPADELLRFGDRSVCASCKPAFVQGLREGAVQPLQARFGGFWIRFLAHLIDTVILYVVNLMIQIPILMRALTGEGAATPAGIRVRLLAGGLQLCVVATYYTFFVGRFAATAGKLACGLRIVTADGGKVSYPRALGRYFASLLSAFTLLIGYIMAAFDEQKRALHDRICDTRVVRV